MSHSHDLRTHHVEADASPDHHRWLSLVLLCLAQFMLIVDITVVQIALPSIGADLDLDREALTWVVTTYTLFFGGMMVLGGRLADAFGARHTLLAGLVIFTVASLACGLAADGAVLIAARAFQGVGAALMSPSALAIVTTTFRGRELGRAMGVWAAIGGAGVALGLLLSGILTSGPGWPWVFFVNVPVGVLLLAAVPQIVRPDPVRETRQRMDLPGAVVVTAATALLIYGLIRAGDDGWVDATVIGSITVAVLLYGLFVMIEDKAAVPLMRLSILTRRPVVAGTLVMLVATALMLTMFFLSSLYLQRTHRFSALETGLAFLPVAVAVTLGAHLAGRLIGRFGGRTVATAAFLLAAVGTALMTQLTTGDNAYLRLLPGFLLATFGIGPVFVVATMTALGNVPQDEAGVASGVLNTFHELGGSIGIAVASTIAAASLVSVAPDVDGYQAALVVSAVVAAVMAILALILVPAGKPSAIAGHGHGHH